MIGQSEPLLLTFFDVMIIVVTAVGVFAVPALLMSKQFRIAAKAALSVLGAIAMNAGAHTIASFWR